MVSARRTDTESLPTKGVVLLVPKLLTPPLSHIFAITGGTRMKAKSSHRPIRISPATRALIRRESKALSLSEKEYVQLVSQLAEAIRGSVLPDGTKDASVLRTLIANPLLLSVAAAMAGTVWNSVKDQLADSEGEAATDTSSTDAVPAPAGQVPQRQPGQPGPIRQVPGPYGYPYQGYARPYPVQPVQPRPAPPSQGQQGAQPPSPPAANPNRPAPYAPYGAQWQAFTRHGHDR